MRVSDGSQARGNPWNAITRQQADEHRDGMEGLRALRVPNTVKRQGEEMKEKRKMEILREEGDGS